MELASSTFGTHHMPTRNNKGLVNFVERTVRRKQIPPTDRTANKRNVFNRISISHADCIKAAHRHPANASLCRNHCELFLD